jgi:HK97 family phage prohead protease
VDNFELRGKDDYKECRAEADGARIKGYAIVFNSKSHPIGGQFREIIAPEAVDRTLTQALDVHAYYDHDSGKVLGRTRAGTLSLRKDARGLAVDIHPDPEVSYVKDLLRLVLRGDVNQMSFGFQVLEDDWSVGEDMPLRTVVDMRISEVSVVSRPAYAATSVEVAMRSLRAFQVQNPPQNRIAWLEKWHKTKLAR